MSTFAVPIKRITAIEPHPNADAIEFAWVEGFRSIAKKKQFRAGDVVAFIPDGAILPTGVLRTLGLFDEAAAKGKLAGPEGNRVKATFLRGELSQGLLHPLTSTDKGLVLTVDTDVGPREHVVKEGDDVALALGAVKYTPELPTELTGSAYVMPDPQLRLTFDVEDWKAHPNWLREGEDVVFTEKLHGVCTVVTLLPFEMAHAQAFGERNNILISSKGLMGEGFAFTNNTENQNNLYVRATQPLIARIDELQRRMECAVAEPMYFIGETYGLGVQDLPYEGTLDFRVFAIAQGLYDNRRYLDSAIVRGAELRELYQFETTPVLYQGPFSLEAMRMHTDGPSTLGKHIREGIVMAPANERMLAGLRVALKSVSEAYLKRRGGTEYS